MQIEAGISIPEVTSADRSSDPRRVAAAGVVGNILEWYDFALYGYLATIFAGQFFPSDSKLTSLISAYAVFAIGFLARPLGGLLYGSIGDRFGRRRLLTISVVMMGLPTFLLGLLPTYQSVGIWAPILLVALRFVQGISTGGEFTGSIIFLVEHAPANRRGLFGSLSNFGSMIGGLAGAAIAWLVVAVLPTAALDDWGWRLPFLSGILITAAGLWIRLGVAESPAFEMMRSAGTVERQPVRAALREHPREIAITAGLNWAVSTGYYIVFVWLASDLSDVIGLKSTTSLGIATAGLFIGTLMVPVAGIASDRWGPRVVLAAAGIAATLGSVPLLFLAGFGTLAAAAAGQIGLAVIVAAFLGTLPAVFVSLHTTRVRCSALSIGYNLAVAVFGGTAPLVATTLVAATGWQTSPGLYFAISALIGLTLLRFVPRRLSDPRFGSAKAS